MIELSVEQLLILGFLVTLIVQLIKWCVVWFKVTEVNKTVLSVVVFVVSAVLAFFWVKPVLPTDWTNPLQIFEILLVAATAVFGMAKIIYEWLLGRILDALSKRTGVPLNTDAILDRKLPIKNG